MKVKYLNEKINFQRGQDPKKSLGIGIEESIHKWMIWVYTSKSGTPWETPKYRINDDLTIDLFEDFEVPDKDIGEFPDYINFNISHESFNVDHTNLKSLRGCPKVVKGYFSCEGNKLINLYGIPENIAGDIFVRGNPGRFEVRDVLKAVAETGAGCRIYSEDSHVWENQSQTMRAKYVNEAIEFQRGGGVKSTMGIGHEGARFTFGKYKGDSAYEVFEKDPQYILWLADGGMSPRDAKQERLLEIIKGLKAQYYEEIEKQGWEFYGNPGEWYEGVVNVEYSKYVSGDYGAAYTIQANDGKHKFRFYYNYNKAEKLVPPPLEEYEGNTVSNYMQMIIGRDIRIKGKVKYHKEYKGYSWTNLNYVNIIEVLD